MPLNDTIPSVAFDVLQRNMQDADKFVNSEELEFDNRPAPNGQTKTRTIAGINKEADDVIDSYRQQYIGAYALPDKTFTLPGQFVVYNNAAFVPESGTQLPFTTDVATYPDPNTPGSGLQFSPTATPLYVQEQAHAGDSQLAGGNIWPVDSEVLLPLGAQSSVIDVTGVTRLLVDTGVLDKGEIIYLWEPSGDFGSTTHTISGISANSLGGYDVTTNQGSFEFTTLSVRRLRGYNSLGYIYAAGFGVTSALADNNTQLLAWRNYVYSVNGIGVLGAGVHDTSEVFVVNRDVGSFIGLVGATIRKTTHNTGGRLNIDCAVYFGEDVDSFTGKIDWTGISVQGISNADRNDYAVYCDKINQCKFKRMNVEWGDVGWNTNDGWLCGLEHVDVRNSRQGINWLSGTSFRGENVWVRECDERGWYFLNTSYSSLQSCGSDNLGDFGSTESTAFLFDSGCEFTLSGTACEGIRGVRLDVRFARITVTGWDDFNNSSGTNANRAAIEVTGSSARLVTINSKFNDYVGVSPSQLNIKLFSDAKIVNIESLYPTNGASAFPGTLDLYGVQISDGEIKPLRDNTTSEVKVEFTASGSASISNGQTIAHGLGTTPKSARLQSTGDRTAVRVISLDSTNITVGMRNYNTDALIVAPETVYWTATYNES